MLPCHPECQHRPSAVGRSCMPHHAAGWQAGHMNMAAVTTVTNMSAGDMTADLLSRHMQCCKMVGDSIPDGNDASDVWLDQTAAALTGHVQMCM